MPRYSEEFKEQAVRKMMSPNAMSVAQVSRDTGVSEQTLYNWRNRFRNKGKAVPADPSNPEHWSGENKQMAREGIPLCQGSCRVHIIEKKSNRGRQESEVCRDTVKSSKNKQYER